MRQQEAQDAANRYAVDPTQLGSGQTLTIGSPEEYCGPEDLASAVRMSRHMAGGFDTRAEISTRGLLHLVQRIYGVSLTTDEGRHPSFGVFVGAEGVSPSHVVVFDPPIEVTVGNLRRVVPAVPAGGHALTVVERAGHLFVDGIMATDDANDVSPPGSPLVSFGLGLPGLNLKVDRPGQIRATENGLTWELRDGSIRPVYHYAVLSVVQNWFQVLALHLVQTLRKRTGDPDLVKRQERLADPGLIFDSVWSSILAGTVAAGHGGAFAILPDDGLEGLTIKHRARGLDLSDAVGDFWLSCFEPDEVGDQGDAAAMEERTMAWEAASRRLTWSARQLANLANVDGCVVLDKHLRLLGFGGEIVVTRDETPNAACVRADNATLEGRGAIDIQQFGTRHRSAFRLCALRPGTLMFVISQDRMLRVFYGHRERKGEVCLWRSLGTGVAAAYRF